MEILSFEGYQQEKFDQPSRSGSPREFAGISNNKKTKTGRQISKTRMSLNKAP